MPKDAEPSYRERRGTRGGDEQVDLIATLAHEIDQGFPSSRRE
jgi:hypothetical protein